MAFKIVVAPNFVQLEKKLNELEVKLNVKAMNIISFEYAVNSSYSALVYYAHREE